MNVGVMVMRINYFLKTTTSIEGEYTILTFDDGPDPVNTPKILDILAKYKVKSIFFLIGHKAEEHPDIVRRIVSEGHLIGNHTNAHNPITALFSRSRLHTEITTAQEIFERITGDRVTLFRPPIGYTNPKFATVLKELNLQCVGWTLRSYDSVYKDPEKLKNRLLSKVRHRHIVLLHDNVDITATILDDFISKANANGIVFASTENIKSILHA